MTRRSVILGLAGAVAICAVTFLNDRVLRGTFFIGNNMPVSVYGLLILFVLLVNPLLRKAALTGREIAVVLALTLAACCIPSSGLLRSFTSTLVLPHHFKKTEPGWRKGGPTAIRPRDVRDLPGLVAAVRRGGDAGDAGARREVWRRLPEELRARLAGASRADAARGDLGEGVRQALNAILQDRTFARAEAVKALELPARVRSLLESDPASLGEADVRELNRGIIDVIFEGCLVARRPGVVEELPERMLADVGRNEDEVLGGFVQGMGEPGRHASAGDVPWYAWTRTLAFWLPVILALWGALMGLSVAIHRQWSEHEHLPYPIATFTESLLPADEGVEKGGSAATPRPGASIFRDRLFWIGAVPVLLVLLNNYAFLWYPKHLYEIPRYLDFTTLAPMVPTFVRGGGWPLLKPTIYVTVIGIAYLIPKDVSLAFGAGPYMWALVAGGLAAVGVTLNSPVEGSSWYLGLKPATFLLFGANLGVFVSIVYTGRRHYLTILRRGVGLRARDEAKPWEVWGIRVFLALMVLFVVQIALLAQVGFLLALLYAAILVVFYVVMSRLIAESGLFYIQPYFFPCVVLWGLFGARAIGPRTLLVMQMLSAVLVIDPRESLMPFMTNSLKLLERRGARLGRATSFAALAIVLGLAVALPVTLYIQYDQGASSIWDSWGDNAVPRMPFANAVAVEGRLAAQGLLEGSDTGSALARLGRITPSAICVWAMLAGLVPVLLFAAARLRFSWWPIHPLLFVTWATEPVKRFCASFLIGWLIKVAVTKYGGGTIHKRLKPLVIGLIAGEVLGALVPSIVSAIYYFATGLPPKPFHVLPT